MANLSYSQFQTRNDYWPTQKWQVEQPKFLGLNEKILQNLNQKLSTDFTHIRSFLIAYKGYIVFEKYGEGFSNDNHHEVCSVTKSVTSALIGIALQQRVLKNVDQKLMNFFPEFNSAKLDSGFHQITLKHLLTMSPGFNCNDTPFFDLWHTSKDPIKFTFNLKLIKEPGNELKYNDPAIHLLSVIISKISGIKTIDFAEKYLFSELGMQKPIWQEDKSGNNWGNFRSSYKPRDLLKFGYLYLNKGNWNGKQILQKEYFKASTNKQISGELFGFPTNYGYLWYIGNYSGIKTFSASGYGGQFIYIIPDMDMVVACTSNLDRHYGENFGLVPEFIIPLSKNQK